MARSSNSKRWLREHHDDPWVKRAQREGYPSRAIYKLMEIDERDRLLHSGMVVVDLGAAPGGWSRYAAARVGDKGRVVALDLLAMDVPPGVEFIQGDFTTGAVHQSLLELTGERGVDLVMSDMAPNISGMKSVDQPRAMYLAELALDLAENVLKSGGDLLVKTFQGEGFDGFVRTLRGRFGKVIVRKPAASRPRSPEVYVLARQYNV